MRWMTSLLMLLQGSRQQHAELSTRVMELQTQHSNSISKRDMLASRLKEATARAASSGLGRTGTRSTPGSQLWNATGSMPSPVLSHLSTTVSRNMSQDAVFQLAPNTAPVRFVSASRA